MKSMLRLIILVAFVSFFVGCLTPEGTVMVSQPPTAKLGNYKTVLITVEPSQADMTENQELLSTVLLWLQNSGNFQKVEASQEPKEGFDLQLKMNMVDIKRVDTGARILVGSWAGQAKVSVQCTLVDLKTKQVVSNFMAEGKSSAHGYDSTRESIKMAGDKVAEYILGNI